MYRHLKRHSENMTSAREPMKPRAQQCTRQPSYRLFVYMSTYCVGFQYRVPFQQPLSASHAPIFQTGSERVKFEQALSKNRGNNRRLCVLHNLHYCKMNQNCHRTEHCFFINFFPYAAKAPKPGARRTIIALYAPRQFAYGSRHCKHRSHQFFSASITACGT
jgi:hypothetical protein